MKIKIEINEKTKTIVVGDLEIEIDDKRSAQKVDFSATKKKDVSKQEVSDKKKKTVKQKHKKRGVRENTKKSIEAIQKAFTGLVLRTSEIVRFLRQKGLINKSGKTAIRRRAYYILDKMKNEGVVEQMPSDTRECRWKILAHKKQVIKNGKTAKTGRRNMYPERAKYMKDNFGGQRLTTDEAGIYLEKAGLMNTSSATSRYRSAHSVLTNMVEENAATKIPRTKHNVTRWYIKEY